jgi:PAS domain-containing protein
MTPGREILSWSRAAERIFGEPHEASIGQSVAPRFREKSTRPRKSDRIDPRARATLIGMDNV